MATERHEAAYQRYKAALPRECCDPMREQFAISADDPFNSGFWIVGNNVEMAVDGEWSCATPFTFCPFCGKRYEFGDPGNG